MAEQLEICRRLLLEVASLGHEGPSGRGVEGCTTTSRRTRQAGSKYTEVGACLRARSEPRPLGAPFTNAGSQPPASSARSRDRGPGGINDAILPDREVGP